MFKIFKKRPQQQTDAELVTRYQESGDMDILGVLYERYVELVYGVGLKYFKDTGLAEDAVMNIFEELTTKVKKHEIKNFRPWLHVLAKNHCLMQLRKKKITVSFDPQLMHSEEIVHPTYGESSENGASKDLKGCIEQLPDSQKQCVTWFYLEEKSYKDIAKMTNLELGKVRSFIQNGRRNLRNCMEKTQLKMKNDT
jgi:RNA polymerase sigma-70 factor (ECF subfamily)